MGVHRSAFSAGENGSRLPHPTAPIPFAVHLLFDSTFGPPPAARPLFVVDDDPNDCALFQQSLKDAGITHPVRFFPTGDKMIEALIQVLMGATPPLACLLDLKMTGMSGLDVLRWIRLQDALSEIAVIMLSSSEDPAAVNRAICWGAQCYVQKFPEPAQLRQIVAEAEKFSSIACGRSSFELSCNLLCSPHAQAS